MLRPVIHVLAGVNGAGKSSVGGYLLARDGLTWFNPDTFARELAARRGLGPEAANSRAWHEGMRRLDDAIANRASYAFETTLGGKIVAERILRATESHDVQILFCGLASPELHIARVIARVQAGGHPIPESKIRERYPKAQSNLIALMPHISYLKVYDNSVEAVQGGFIPEPLLLLEMDHRKVIVPEHDDLDAIERMPEWARPIVEAALRIGRTR